MRYRQMRPTIDVVHLERLFRTDRDVEPPTSPRPHLTEAWAAVMNEYPIAATKKDEDNADH